MVSKWVCREVAWYRPYAPPGKKPWMRLGIGEAPKDFDFMWQPTILELR